MTRASRICNLCGKEFDIWDEQEDFSIYRSLGYGTKYDGEILKLDICCDCMDKLIEKCVVNPILRASDVNHCKNKNT